MSESAEKILNLLEEEYPYVRGTALIWKTPIDLLVAAMLSAQSTDEKVNEVTKSLFKKYHTSEDYAYAPNEELEEDIKSTGFYRRKARFIREACRAIVEEYGGEVPRSMEELTGLKGVARKTANIVLGNAFGIVKGIAVDTHVMRLSKRLGLTDERYREKIEGALMEIVRPSKWFQFSNLLIEHGRRVCNAKKPDCASCILKELCPSAFTFPHNRR